MVFCFNSSRNRIGWVESPWHKTPLSGSHVVICGSDGVVEREKVIEETGAVSGAVEREKVMEVIGFVTDGNCRRGAGRNEVGFGSKCVVILGGGTSW